MVSRILTLPRNGNQKLRPQFPTHMNYHYHLILETDLPHSYQDLAIDAVRDTSNPHP